MGWSRIDDSLDGHPKHDLVSLAADGLWVHALARCNRYRTDGYIDASWVRTKMRKLNSRQRASVLAELLEFRILDALIAHQVCTVDAPIVHGLRTTARAVNVGPFPTDGYLVHDYLHYNPTRAELEEQREKERLKKAGQRAQDRPASKPGGASEDVDVPGGLPPMSPSGCGVGQPGSGSQTFDAGAFARSNDPRTQGVIDLLSQAPRLHLDAVGVENAIAAWPKGDPVQAARQVVTWATDPAFRMTNGARALDSALSKQQQRSQQATATVTHLRPRAGQPTADDFLREGSA